MFENNMSQWMEGFHTYLTSYSNPLLEQPEGSESPGPIESVQVCLVPCTEAVSPYASSAGADGGWMA